MNEVNSAISLVSWLQDQDGVTCAEASVSSALHPFWVSAFVKFTLNGTEYQHSNHLTEVQAKSQNIDVDGCLFAGIASAIERTLLVTPKDRA